jgi:sporadic carbohydrate cluster protein (TIGR04323 family)
MKRIRGYIFSRPFMGERVPQHVQNLVIRDYCQRQGLHYLLSATEYAMAGSQLILAQVLDDLGTIDGIAAYSVFQLPEDAAARSHVYARAFAFSEPKGLYFALEGIAVTQRADCARVETLWRIRRAMVDAPVLVS